MLPISEYEKLPRYLNLDGVATGHDAVSLCAARAVSDGSAQVVQSVSPVARVSGDTFTNPLQPRSNSMVSTTSYGPAGKGTSTASRICVSLT